MLNNHHTLPVPTLVLRKSTLCLPLLNHTATLRADTIKATVPILLPSLATHRDPSEPILPPLDLRRRTILPHIPSDRRQYMGSRRSTVPRRLTAASLSRRYTLPASRPRKRRRSHTPRRKPPRSNKRLPPLKPSRLQLLRLSRSPPLSRSRNLSLKHNLRFRLRLRPKFKRSRSHSSSRAALPTSMTPTRRTLILTYKRGRSITRRVERTRRALSTSSPYLGSRKDLRLRHRPLSHSRTSRAAAP